MFILNKIVVSQFHDCVIITTKTTQKPTSQDKPPHKMVEMDRKKLVVSSCNTNYLPSFLWTIDFSRMKYYRSFLRNRYEHGGS